MSGLRRDTRLELLARFALVCPIVETSDLRRLRGAIDAIETPDSEAERMRSKSHIGIIAA